MIIKKDICNSESFTTTAVYNNETGVLAILNPFCMICFPVEFFQVQKVVEDSDTFNVLVSTDELYVAYSDVFSPDMGFKFVIDDDDLEFFNNEVFSSPAPAFVMPRGA